MTILDSIFSLGRNINKAVGRQNESETEEGVVSDKFPELKLTMSSEEILKLTGKWIKRWDESEVKSKWDEHGKENEEYWMGKQHNQPKGSNMRPLVDNVIFEALETYLPQVTRRNPDPMIELSRKEEQTPENLEFAKELQKELGEISDELVLRLKLKKVARHWAIYLLGAAKVGWDLDKDIPTLRVVRPKKLILDPDATVDEEGYTGEYIGEYRKLTADKILSILKTIGGEEGAEKAIKDLIKDDEGKTAQGTEIQFIEWWTPEYMCWTLGSEEVLLKIRNPHWNYDFETEGQYAEGEEPEIDEETGETIPRTQTVEGFNHLAKPGIPYLLLSVFNLGKQPVDETSLIGQNLASQDLVNKRVKQIDKNADSMNGGMVVSLERSGLTQAQAKGVTDALRRGGTVTIPAGAVQDAVQRMSAPSLPNDVYLQLQDTRTRMRDIFGTRGSSPAGLSDEKTVRGKLQNRMLDTDRIGGGLSEYLEQLADGVYNWFTQLLFVYDDRYLQEKGQKPRVRISVKEGSLLPKDSLTMANQAIDLASQNRMSLLDLYKALDYPNPEEMAANVWLEANAPDILLQNDQRIQQVLQRSAEGERKEPSKSINYKDLPPAAQAELLKQAGIEMKPEGIVAYQGNQTEKELDKATAEKMIDMVASGGLGTPQTPEQSTTV